MIARQSTPRSLLLTLLVALAPGSWAEPAAAQSRPVQDEAAPQPQDPPQSLPVATDEPIAKAEPIEPDGLPPAPEPRPSHAMGAAITFELGGQGAHVDLDGAKTGVGGALGGRMFILGYSRAMTYRLLVNGAIGGQTTGFLTRFSGDASVGPAVAIGSSTRLFMRIGMEASGHKDDVLDTSLFTVPSGFAGIQLGSSDVLFEIGPRVGTTLRALYAPGNETEGRRHTRRSRVAPSWGGTMALVSPILLASASVTRVEQRAGLWLAEGSACPIVLPRHKEGFVVCATAQHWRGAVSGPLGDVTDVGSWVLGASIGFGFFNNKRRP